MAAKDLIPQLNSLDELNSLLFEVMSDGVLIVEECGRIIDCNPSFHHRLGFHKHEIVGNNVRDLDPPEFAARVSERIATIIKQGSAVFETAHYRKDGTIMPVEISARFVKIDGNTVMFAIVRDISERKKSEQALRDKESQVHALFQYAPEGIFLADSDGIYTDVNEIGARLVGYRADELVGMSIVDLIDKEEIPRLQEHKAQLLAGDLTPSEWELIRKDGSIVPVEVSARILEDGRWQGFVRDISERRKMDAALREKERMYTALSETSADGYWVADTEGRLLEVNDAYIRRSGYSREELLKMRIPDLEATESSDETRAHIEKIINYGHDRFETTHRTKSGEVWPVEIVTTFYPFNGGTFLVFAIDISERNQAQHEIAKQQKELSKLTQALEYAGEGILITDTQGTIEYVNRAFSKISGYTFDAAVGNNTSILKSDAQDPAVYRDLWHTISNGEVWEGTLIDRRQDGSFYPALVSIAPVFDDAGEITHYVSTHRDVTELKRMERHLLQAQKMESMGTLVGGIAHDFNNMLAAVQGNTYLAARHADKPATVSKRLDAIRALTDRAASIVKQLLTFAKKDIVELEPVDLNALIREGFKLARSTIPENIEHRLSSTEQPLVVNADITQLHQVMINLTNNARDALEKQTSPTIHWILDRYEADAEFQLKHPDHNHSHFARITIQDNGEGIRKKHLEAIFDPFFTTKEPGKGTGLGLAMVFGSIERLGGVVEVDSQYAKGTSFHLYIPLLETEQVHTTDNQDTPIRGRGETILLADDNEELRITTAEVLTDLGYRVIEAENGAAALKQYEANPESFDLILSDIVMPQLGGVELYHAIRNHDVDLPIILATGYDQEKVASTEIDLNRCQVISKPFSYIQLSQIIRVMIQNRGEA